MTRKNSTPFAGLKPRTRPYIRTSARRYLFLKNKKQQFNFISFDYRILSDQVLSQPTFHNRRNFFSFFEFLKNK